ncbi:S41 family peptidase [Sneathiella sp.]|jgi:carboxyl-terminal processing protease|uniref:S41 family peptidase n=1 Tax=Sneathiella sp. TaxID=1964365 RepID=UPI0039E4F5D2
MLKKPLAFLSLVLFLAACALPSSEDKAIISALDRYEKAYFQIIGKSDNWPEERDTISTALQRINLQYVDAVDTDILIDEAINGLQDTNSSIESPTERALTALTAALDKNSGYMTPAAYKRYQENLDGHFTGFGFRIEMRDNRITVITPLEGSSAKEAGILPDDVITHLNGEDLSKYSFQEAIAKMRGPEGSHAVLTIERPGVDTPIKLGLVRRPIDITVVEYKVDGTVGYIRIHTFNRKTADKVDEALTHFSEKLGTKLCGVILDMRNNPGGLVNAAVDVADQFLEEGNIFAAINRGRSFSTENAHAGDRINGRPILVMLNKGSASAAEIVAGALQSQDRAKIFGQTSYGKGTMQTLYDLDNGGGLRLTTGRFTAGGGISFNGTGLNPDIPDDVVKGESTLAPIARAGKALACAVSVQTAAAMNAQ